MKPNIDLGTKIEMYRRMDRFNGELSVSKTYLSQVLDYENDEIVCAMPFFEGRLMPLEIESEYEMIFYTSQGIYKSIGRIISRNKSENIYTVNIKLETELEKFQRREYYRLSCTIEVLFTPLNEEETQYFLKNSKLPANLQEIHQKAIIVDISGGGVRVFTQKQYNIASFVSLSFEINISGKNKRFVLPGKVVLSLESPNISDIYDTRVEFKRIAQSDRQEIIKYIFEQQRRLRKMERG